MPDIYEMKGKNYMIYPIFTLFILSSIVWLVIGLKGGKAIALLTLNLYWWLGSFVSAYFTLLAWQDRGYSENWAMIGFIFFSLPYILTTIVLIIVELFFIRKWQSDKTKAIKFTSVILLFFLIFQIIIGFLSA